MVDAADPIMLITCMCRGEPPALARNVSSLFFFQTSKWYLNERVHDNVRLVGQIRHLSHSWRHASWSLAAITNPSWGGTVRFASWVPEELQEISLVSATLDDDKVLDAGDLSTRSHGGITSALVLVHVR